MAVGRQSSPAEGVTWATSPAGLVCFRTEMTPDERVQQLASRQASHVTWAQAMDCGLTAHQVGYRVKTRGWTAVLPRVYRLPGAPDPIQGRLWAVQLWMGDDGFFTGRTAAFLLGVQGLDSPAPISVARSSGTRIPGVQIRRLKTGERPRTRWRNGLRIASVERTMLDLCITEPASIVGEALDDVLRRRLTTIARLREALERDGGRGRKGSSVLRRELERRDERDGEVRSVFETKMLRILRRAGVDLVPNFRVDVSGQTFFIDFYIPSARLGIECHSMGWHGPSRHDRDARRHRLLVEVAGIELLYYTWDDVVSRPEEVEREIRRAVQRRQLRLSTET